MPINTLKVARDLKRHGFTDDQAEGLAEAIDSAVSGDLATRADLNAVAQALRSDLTKEMQALELRLIKWLLGTVVGSVLAGTVAVIGVLVKFVGAPTP